MNLEKKWGFFFSLPCILHRCKKFVSLEQPPESALPNMQIYRNMQLQQIHPSPSSEAVPVWHWNRRSDDPVPLSHIPLPTAWRTVLIKQRRCKHQASPLGCRATQRGPAKSSYGSMAISLSVLPIKFLSQRILFLFVCVTSHLLIEDVLPPHIAHRSKVVS